MTRTETWKSPVPQTGVTEPQYGLLVKGRIKELVFYVVHVAQGWCVIVYFELRGVGFLGFMVPLTSM